MITTMTPICGCQIGFELYDQEVNDQEIGYLLIDLFILRIQFAWYKS